MMNAVVRFNRWYDGLKEPKRFGFFMLLMFLSVFPLQLGVSMWSTPYAAWATPLMLYGMTTTMLVCCIAVHRALGLGGKHKYVAHGIMGLLAFITLCVWVLVLF